MQVEIYRIFVLLLILALLSWNLLHARKTGRIHLAKCFIDRRRDPKSYAARLFLNRVVVVLGATALLMQVANLSK